MKNKIHFSHCGAFIVALGALLLLPTMASAGPIRKTATAGPYSVTLAVLPAESFRGSHAKMVRDAGAQPNTLNGPDHPNHHMVVFIKQDGKPVKNAKVGISYRRLSPKMGAWAAEPVVRMHAAGKGPGTTHYGNNVRLAPGSYQVRVTVDGSGPATFRFTLPS